MAESEGTIQNTEAPAEAAATTAAPPSIIKKMIKKVPLNLLRFWWAFVLIPCVAIGVAAVASGMMASTSYTFKSMILYTQIPIDSAAEKLYQPPGLKTMSQFIKSPEVLGRVVEELNLDIPERVLANQINIEEPKSMQRIGLELMWDDEEKGPEVLDSLAKQYGEYIAGIRKDIVGGYITDLKKALERNQREMAAAQQRQREFNPQQATIDASAELEALTSRIANNESKILEYRRLIEETKTQLDQLGQKLADQKKSEEMESAAAKEAEAAEESVADNRRRQDRLNELIAEQRRINEIQGAIDAKQKEFARKLQLYQKGYISRSDFETVSTELNTLRSKIMEGEQIEKWKKELKTIDQVVVPSNNKKRKGSPIIQQLLATQMMLNLKLLGQQRQLQMMEIDVVEDRKRTTRLLAKQQEFTRQQKAITAKNDERVVMNTQLSALQSIYDYGPYEFTIIDPAGSTMTPPSSNKKKLFILFFVGITVVLSAPFALLAVLLSLKETVDEGCADRGLAIMSPRRSLLALLSESKADAAHEFFAWTRHVSLRLQQILPKRAAVMSVFSASHRQRDIELLAAIAGVLADRDERVLIIESSPPVESEELTRRRRMAESQHAGEQVLEEVRRAFSRDCPGLFDFLHSESAGVDEMVRPYPGEQRVDLISVGRLDGKFDRLFSRRMNELLEVVRERYSVILIYGPELHRTIDVELQASHSDGILIMHDRAEPFWHGLRTTFASLVELNAPLLGSIVRPAQFGAPNRPKLFRRMLAEATPMLSRVIRRRRERATGKSLVKQMLMLPLLPVRLPLISLKIFLGVISQSTRKNRKQNGPESSTTSDVSTLTPNHSSGLQLQEVDPE